MPVGVAELRRGLRAGVEVFHALKKTLHDRGLATAVGDEGGFAPDLESNEAALQALVEGIEAAGYRPGDDVAIALDPATSEIFEGGAYVLEHEGRTLSSERDGRLLGGHGLALPDPLDRGRHGRGGLGRLEGADRTASASSVQLVGDDLFVTNTERLQRGIDAGVANSILVKVNQIGTLTETLDAVRMAARGRLHRGDVAPLGRDRGHDDRRPRRGHRLRPDQDRRAVALGPGRRSTTSCCGSRRRWAPTRRTRAEACSGARKSGKDSAPGREGGIRDGRSLTATAARPRRPVRHPLGPVAPRRPGVLTLFVIVLPLHAAGRHWLQQSRTAAHSAGLHASPSRTALEERVRALPTRARSSARRARWAWCASGERRT